jgi:hypothetical protein
MEVPMTSRKKKHEQDADTIIRRYVESDTQRSGIEEESTQTEWYDQAKQDTVVPPQAVLSGGDLDAAWDQAAVGDETVGGSSPTPDQDVVDEIGEALGVQAEEGEPLRTTEKLEGRDRHRWELNPASSEDFEVRNQQIEDDIQQTKKRTERVKRRS